MAKMKKRFLAMVLVLALCAGQIAVPAIALETVSGSGTPEDPKVTMTVTVGSDGSITTDINSEWKSESSQVGGSTSEGNPSVEVSTNVSTTVEGQDSVTENISHNAATNIETITGSKTGWETTTVDGTTVTTTTTTGALITEENDSDNPAITTKDLESSDVSSSVETKGTATDNDWVEEDLVEGTDVSEGTTTINSTEKVELETPGDVTLNLTPGKTTKKTIQVTLEDVSSGAYTLPTSGDYVVEQIIEDGKLVGWTVTTSVDEITAEDPYETITGESVETQIGEVVQKAVRPEGYTVGETTEGNVKTIVEEITDGEGNFLGYKVTKITTNETETPSTIESDRTITTPDSVETGFVMPEKPEESVTTDKYGYTTTVTVEEIVENGKSVGWKTISVTTSEDGEVFYTETKSIYGTSSSITTSTAVDPETEEIVTTTNVTTTEVEEIYLTESTRQVQITTERTEKYETTIITEQDTYQLVETEDGGLYFLYQGQMYVVDNSYIVSKDVSTGANVSVDGYTSADDLRTSDKYTRDYTGEVLSSDNSSDGVWTHVGHGQFSGFVARDSNDISHATRQFQIKDGNEIRYVYCVELGAGIKPGTYYSSTEYDVTNDSVAPWTGASGTVELLRSVAENGYWGTESGQGSLEAVKQLMKDNGIDQKYIDNLTPGMALTATQVALWEYGSKEGVTFSGNYVTWDDSTDSEPSKLDSDTITKLSALLIKLAEEYDDSQTIETIDGDDITGASITIKDKATDDSGTVKTDAQNNELYNTDLSFTMDVSTSSITGDLILEITDANGREIGKYRLAGENSNFLSLAKITPDENGVYTIKDVELAEGVVVTLNLSGVQYLDSGVVIYKGANDKQDFIGLCQRENNVDITVSLAFTVDDPEIEHTSTTTTQTRTDTQKGTKTDTRTDTTLTTRNVAYGTEVTQTTHDVKVYGTITVTETKKDITEEKRDWNAQWKYTLLTIDGDDGDVTVADAPKTGDISMLWAVLAMASVGGMVLLKKREDA